MSDTEIMDAPPEAADTEDDGWEEAISTLLRLTTGYYAEARDAKQWRLSVNKTNREAFLGIQDWGDKFPGQSTEFLPKTAVAVEQFAAFFKRALTQAGPDWYEIVPPANSPLTGAQCRNLLNLFLDNMLLNDQDVGSLHTVLADLARIGATESLCIAKVHGNMVPSRVWSGKSSKPDDVWRLRVDVIPFESYFADPTGKALYSIHEVERDLWEVQARADEGLYDKAAVDMLAESCRLRQDGARDDDGIEQSPSTPPPARKKVTVRECWGTVLDDDGHALMHNAVWAIANGTHVIRMATENPFWHGESPFVCTPILRVPFSTHHKAIFDDAASLNLAMNELFNLLVDGGIASVWGIRQFRSDWLENPDQYSDGIGQGETISVNAQCPPGEKVLEIIAQGSVPTDAMAMFEALNREFTQAALTTELRLGQLPSKSVKATEVVASDQGTSALLDGIAGDLERTLITPLLRKAFLTVLQFMDSVPMPAIASVIGDRSAMLLMQEMKPEERFAAFAGAGIKVRGLSAVLEKVQTFQKLMALLQVVTTNPIMLQAFFRKYNPQALLAYMMKALQVDPSDFQRALSDETSLEQDMQTLPAFQQLLSNRGEGLVGTPSVGGPGTGGDAMAAQVNQTINPMSGMTANQ